MSPDADHDPPMPDAEGERLRNAVRQLVLMKETGPKSAAWHRARVQTIWRLQRALKARTGASMDDRRQRRDTETDAHAA